MGNAIGGWYNSGMMPFFQFAARMGRIPFPALAAAVGLLFAAAGFAVLDDYGVGTDELAQRKITTGNIDYVMGHKDALPFVSDRFYGLAFELPLLMAERALGLQDSRDIFLMRHLLTHLFFIVGGLFCGLLVYRMFGSRRLALLAMLLFLLHPRLYAHSFFNSKDVPFTVMFMIALYLTHRAFQRDTIGAFALLGAVVGLAVNLRPFALLLPAAVLAMRGLDWKFAANPLRRKHILVTGGVFAVALMLTIYIIHPYYWENPLRFFDGLRIMSQHPTLAPNLFMGENIRADAVPPEFIPVWFGITTPAAALLLGGIGATAALIYGIRRPERILRAGRRRFMLLHLGCFALPVIATVVWQFNIYHGWRQLYFLWAPFCLLAAAGLHWLAGNVGGGDRKGREYLGLARRAGMYALAGAALAGAIGGIVSLHPHQYAYFNSLAGWGDKESIGARFDLDYWGVSYRQGFEHLLERYPKSPLYIYAGSGGDIFHFILSNLQIMREDDRNRLFWVSEGADFYIYNDYSINNSSDPEFAEVGGGGKRPEPVIHSIKAYNNVILTITAPGLSDVSPEALADVYRAKYQDIVNDVLLANSGFDIYISEDGRSLSYAKTDCATYDLPGWFFLHVFPKDERDLPAEGGEYGFQNIAFPFYRHGGRVDDQCWAEAPLPDYPIERIRTGQREPDGEAAWIVELNPSLLARLREIEARLPGLRPVAAGPFRLYRDGDQLVYYRESCVAGDTRARFFLHLFPADGEDLPVGRGEYGFDNLGFDFDEYGAHRGGTCVAAVSLSEYEIARIRTGQYLPGQGQIWAVDFMDGE